MNVTFLLFVRVQRENSLYFGQADSGTTCECCKAEVERRSTEFGFVETRRVPPDLCCAHKATLDPAVGVRGSEGAARVRGFEGPRVRG